MKLIVIVLVIWIGTAIAWSYYRTNVSPCEFRTYESLNSEFPSLKTIWDEKIEKLNQREYEEKIISAELELLEKQGHIDKHEVIERELLEFNKTIQLIEIEDKKYQEKCLLLTGT